MKQILHTLILSAVVLCSCVDRNHRTSTNEASDAECNPLASYIENEDSVFAVVEDSILQYASLNDIAISGDKVSRYNTIDSLLHIIYSSKTPQITSADIHNDLAITVNHIRFLNHYLLRELKDVVNNQISHLLYQEQALADSLVSAQHSFLTTHIDDAYMDGSCGFIKYHNVEIAIISDLNSSLKDLLCSSASPEVKVDDSTRELSQSVFDNEFRHILNDLIPQKPLPDDTLLPSYDENADRQSVILMQNRWNELLCKRDEIAKLLPHRQKQSWDYSTCRFQRTQLITLKNEFVNMGVYGSETEQCILADNCTYEQLLAYPNFSTKWEEHLLEL